MNNAEKILRAKSDLAILEGAQPVTPEIAERIAAVRAFIQEAGEAAPESAPPMVYDTAPRPGLLSRAWSALFGDK